MMTALEEAVDAYRIVSIELAQQEQVLKARREEWEREHKNEIETVQKLRVVLSEEDKRVREAALEEHRQTGEKKLYAGISIKMFTTLEYTEEEAFSWAMEHDLALTLDKKVFEKIAKAQELAFVKSVEQPKAMLPKELTA